MWVNFYINLNSDKTRIHHVSSALHVIRVCNMRLHISSLLPGEPTRPTTHQEAQDVKLTHPHTRGKLFFPTYGSTCLIFHLNMQPFCSVPGGVKCSLHLVNDAGSQFLQGKPPENTNHARSARVEKRAASAAWNWQGFPSAPQFLSLNIHLAAHRIPNSSIMDMCRVWSSSDSLQTWTDGELEVRRGRRVYFILFIYFLILARLWRPLSVSLLKENCFIYTFYTEPENMKIQLK